MISDVQQLQNLRATVKEQEERLQFFISRSEHLAERVLLLQAKLFGRKSEAHILAKDDKQLSLFDDFEETEETSTEQESDDEEIIVPSYKRKKPGRKPLPADLPRIDVIHDIPEDEKICACGCKLSKIDEEIAEKLDIIPPQIRVIRNIRYKYACKNCEGTESKDPVVKIAPVPVQLIPKGIATSGLVAYIAISKFADGLPLYRQEKQFLRIGVEIPRATMANWLVYTANRLEPLYELLFKNLRSGPLVSIDETTYKVMNEPGRSNKTKSYMWVFAGGDPEKPVLVYKYDPKRSGDVPMDILREYKGYIQTDGYSGYDPLGRLSGIKHLGCWAHARRNFVDVVTAAKRIKKRKRGKAETAIKYIKRLYAIEKKAKLKEYSYQEIYELRQKEAKPILSEFKKWLDEEVKKIPPKGLLGKAVNYTLNQWEKLVRYIEDGRLKPDNNLVENAIRPFVLGRKNWLFSMHPNGARASAIFFSLIETAKANNMEPYKYLRFVLSRLPFIKSDEEYEQLLPQNIDSEALDSISDVYV